MINSPLHLIITYEYRLNYIARIIIIATLVFNTFLFTWIVKTFEDKSYGDKSITIGPMFIAVNRHWYFIGEIFDCERYIFGEEF